MAELSKKWEPKRYAKSSEDPFGTEEPIMTTVQITNDVLSGRSRTSEGSSTDSSDPLTETTQASRTRAISLQSVNDEMHEFDVDLLYSWDQSSGTISYEAWSSSLVDTFNDAKLATVIISTIAHCLYCLLLHTLKKYLHKPEELAVKLFRKLFLTVLHLSDFKQPQQKDIICRAQLDRRLLRDTIPPQQILTAKSLTMLNEAMRQDRIRGHLLKRIVTQCERNGNAERYEFISKMCDDVISEYVASNGRNNKLLEINLECGGDMPPRLKINGIRAERSPKCEDINEKCRSAKQISEVHNVKHLFQHRSACSPALPYPSAATFGRCSIEDYVKMLKKRRKQLEEQ
ncbi:unnamed protein product [Litomosoides sigmodontis]|uniref:Uncharacterized protein n=1 Tax=Litomosoides sigmodontis TaxID=42156 RepID=A0A3P6SCJ6_LITSI|nr:unnamed protein product [Litomosoides sigmodontis]